MDAQVCHVWDVKEGKVTRFQQYADTALQMGPLDRAKEIERSGTRVMNT